MHKNLTKYEDAENPTDIDASNLFIFIYLLLFV